jgi:predicted ATPase/DNA-binding winged helix-turn-helix (wHTH) protein/Tfp pilus assembly protein PilF
MRSLYEIGPLRLDPEARVLTHAGAPLALGARAIAVLATLVGQAQQYVSKSAILDAAWPGLVVEEANLAVQISAIRRVLARVPGGDGWIETLARRGYRFVGPVVAIADPRAPAAAVDRTRTNLPQLLTSFVGRERELAEIKQRLPSTRMLTLTGTGGIGKTRLALQAANEVREAYRDGAWFVDLSPLVDPTLVPSALAQVLGVKEAAGQPLQATLCAHLRGKEVLLILDNCEQVLAAVADLAEAVLGATAKVTIVATSREPLHVGGEQLYPVAALPLPARAADAKGIARSDAVQLFVERARAHRPSFDLEGPRARAVADICVRLDGIPLALELAAARIAVLPVEQIVRLLDQRFRLLTSGSGSDVPRHQTLRAMLDWSYDLLNENERLLLARFSVFAGGFTLAAAEAVAIGDPIAKDDVVYLLIALVEQSLLVADEDGDRYRMLETVREYAREKLNASASADTFRTQHRDYFLALAEEAEPKLMGEEQTAWLRRLEGEHENLRASLDWSLMDAGSSGSLRLCGALARFWHTRGHFSEGRELCARVLDNPGARKRTAARAKVLNAAGGLAHLQGDYPAARTWYEERLSIARELGTKTGIASALTNLGSVVRAQGDIPIARAMYEEALAFREELADRALIAGLLNNLGTLVRELGDFSDARAMYEESLAIKRELGDKQGIANTLNNLGLVASAQGESALARALYEESLAIKRELGDRRGIANSLTNLAGEALEQGEFASARTLDEESLAICRELEFRRGITNSLEGLASVDAALGNSLRAATVWGAAERLRTEVGAPLVPLEQLRYDRRVAAVRGMLGDDAAFDRAWQEGRSLTIEKAIELVLKEATERER